MNIPSIDEVAAMSDQELGEFLNFSQKLKDFRVGVGKLAKLSGKAKTEADRIWRERLMPRLESYDLKWIQEDAERSAKPRDENSQEAVSELMYD